MDFDCDVKWDEKGPYSNEHWIDIPGLRATALVQIWIGALSKMKNDYILLILP